MLIAEEEVTGKESIRHVACGVHEMELAGAKEIANGPKKKEYATKNVIILMKVFVCFLTIKPYDYLKNLIILLLL